MTDRVCIFIDGSNFYHALREAKFPTSVDFGKLSRQLTGPQRRHIQTYYYNTPLLRARPDDVNYERNEKQYRDQQKFFGALRFIDNFTFRRGRFQRLPNGGVVEKGVDVALATDMITLAFKDRYDVAILVSSDADYKPAIEAVKLEVGKIVELCQVKHSKAYDLITACSVYAPITRAMIEQSLWQKKNKSKRKTP